MAGYRTVFLLLALVGAVVGGCLMQRQQASPPQQEQSGYVGSEVCIACHGDLAENFHPPPCQAPPTSLPRARGALGVRGLSWSWRSPRSRWWWQGSGRADDLS